MDGQADWYMDSQRDTIISHHNRVAGYKTESTLKGKDMIPIGANPFLLK